MLLEININYSIWNAELTSWMKTLAWCSVSSPCIHVLISFEEHLHFYWHLYSVYIWAISLWKINAYHNSRKQVSKIVTLRVCSASYHHLASPEIAGLITMSVPAVLFKNVLILKQLLLLLLFRIAVFIHLCQWIITWAWNRAGENMKEIS